jgi:hypothetical protein
MKSEPEVKVSTRGLAKSIAAQHGITLDAAQRVIEASAKSAAAKHSVAAEREPLAERIASERGT